MRINADFRFEEADFQFEEKVPPIGRHFSFDTCIITSVIESDRWAFKRHAGLTAIRRGPRGRACQWSMKLNSRTIGIILLGASNVFRHFTQFEFLDFAGRRLGQFGEDDVFWTFKMSEMFAAIGDDLVG